MSNEIGFGDYVEIEQKRYGVPNEMYRYKVIGSFRSNSYVNVPVQSPETETIINHEVVPVLACICCGVNEVNVRNFRLEDVKIKRPEVKA
jgi:hypothetical protein